MIIVTGGAGMIGSGLVWGLNKRGRNDIIIVDEIDHDEKERNIAPLRYETIVDIAQFRKDLNQGLYDNQSIEAVLHLGANSSTSETNWELLQDMNVDYTKDIINWCDVRDVRCIYASSGQVYGLGERGFSDDHELFDQLQTVTLYGKSKLEVDIWARDAGYLDKVVGIRYFNVFGPNENHKEHMRSVVAKFYPKIRDEGKIELFRSHLAEFKDGEQKRDFVYLKDAIEATLFFLDNSQVAGMYNVGTGQARTWNDVAKAMFAAMGREPHIEYVDMPESLKMGYQSYTQADISKLKAAGYTKSFMTLEAAVTDYIQNYLEPDKHLGD